MDLECDLFYEDVVFKTNDKGQLQYGIVIENSAYISSDDEDSDVEAELLKPRQLKQGQVKVAWHPLGNEEIVSERKIHLLDRALMPGDVVSRKEHKLQSQKGYCRSVRVLATVQVIGTRQVLCDIPAELLQPLEEFVPDVAVALDNWVGMVRRVNSLLTLRTADGSVCTMTDDQALALKDVSDRRKKGSEFHRYDFYPGQQLSGKLSLFANALWVKGSLPNLTKNKRDTRRLRVTVEDIEVTSLNVHWECQSSLQTPTNGQQLASVEKEDLKRVKVLNVFEPCTLQVGDRSYYTIKETDILYNKDEWERKQREVLLGSSPSNNNVRRASETEGEGTKEKTQQENGEESSDSDDYENMESDTLSESGSHTSSSSSFSHSKSKASKKQGLVTKVLKRKKLRRARPKERTTVSLKPGDKILVDTLATNSCADVVWQDGTVECGIPSRLLLPNHHLDDQEFFPGDYVIGADEECGADPLCYGVVQKVDHQGRTANVFWFKSESHGDVLQSTFIKESDVSVYDLKDHPDFKYRPGSVVIRVGGESLSDSYNDKPAACIAGQVLDVSTTGKLHVWWANGETSYVWPQELYRIGEYDSDDGELWDDDDEEASDESWETESEESVLGDEEKGIQRLKTAVAYLRESQLAMQRVQSMLTQHPSFQTTELMQKLLEVYKICRFLDRQLGTSYFHEYYFKGLIDRKAGNGLSRITQQVETATEQLRRYYGVDVSSSAVSKVSSAALAEFDRSIHHFLTEVCSMTDQLKIISHDNGIDDALPAETPLVLQDQSQAKESNGGAAAAGPAQSLVDYDMVHVGHLNVCARLSRLMASQLEKMRVEVAKRCEEHNLPPVKETTSSVTRAATPNPAPTAEPEAEYEEDPIEDVETLGNLVQERGVFTLVDTCPPHHRFACSEFKPVDRKLFHKAVRHEMHLLQTSLPPGIDVKCYEDRMDLCSVLIRGPAKTPYEDGLFFFDIQLSPDYPRAPPVCHYHSYCTDRLNPNLYEDGKVCVSLLGTWSGKGTEVWGPGSNLLQVLVSIQGLILVSEPYYNEAGYERQKGSLQAQENSRMYNEMVLLKLLQSMTKMIWHPPPLFQEEVRQHFSSCALKIVTKFTTWLKISEEYNSRPDSSDASQADKINLTGPKMPEFPLLPASRGFCLTLRSAVQQFQKACQAVLGLGSEGTLEPSPGNQ